ncbi:MAG: SIMPL domain-containing protein [Candidatus Baltobacteraceae bacterium]
MPISIRQMPNTPGVRSDPRGGGITVNGSGQADGAADLAHVTLNISSRNNALTLNKRTLQPVVDALLRAHVEPSSIVEPIYLQGAASTNYATVGGTVNHPTVAMLQDGMQTLTSAFAAMPDVLVNQAAVGVTMTECAALRTKARRAALVQARRQALEIASASNVQLGKILSVQAYGEGGGPMDLQFPNSCTSYYQIGPGNMPQFMSLADYLKVRVNSNVNVTYAIR